MDAADINVGENDLVVLRERLDGIGDVAVSATDQIGVDLGIRAVQGTDLIHVSLPLGHEKHLPLSDHRLRQGVDVVVGRGIRGGGHDRLVVKRSLRIGGERKGNGGRPLVHRVYRGIDADVICLSRTSQEKIDDHVALCIRLQKKRQRTLMSEIGRGRELRGGDLYLSLFRLQIAVHVHGVDLDLLGNEALHRGGNGALGDGVASVGDENDPLQLSLTEERCGKVECRRDVGSARIHLCVAYAFELPARIDVDHTVASEADHTQHRVGRKRSSDLFEISVHLVKTRLHRVRNVNDRINLRSRHHGGINESRRRGGHTKRDQNVENERGDPAATAVVPIDRDKERNEEQQQKRDRQKKPIRIIEADIFHNSTPSNPQ